MEKCKYCHAELEENSRVCPSCGKAQEEEGTPVMEETAETEAVTAEETPAEEVPAVAEEVPEEAPAPEEKPAQIKEGIKATPGKIAAAVAIVVLVIAALVAMIVKGTAAPEEAPETTSSTEATAEAAEPTDLMATEATIPADGNPDDVTCKGSYTADDETVIAAADTVVATMGDAQLTVSQLQVYYWMEVNSFLNNLYYYGYDATYFGLDYTLGLDYQTCGISDVGTWQQFFLGNALGTWQNYQSLVLEAREAGYEMEEQYRTELDNLPENLQIQAESYGMADARELLAYNVGNGAQVEDYIHYVENSYLGGSYLDAQTNKVELSEAELEAFYTENEESYIANGLTKDLRSVDVRHILVFPEGADSTTIYTETFSDEAWAAGEAQAREILDAWLAGDMTEESFAALANEYSADPGSNTNGGLYTDVMQGDMVAEFNAWCFDETRQAGDYAIVKTDLGFHIMYFSGSELLWPTYVREDMLVEHQQALLDAALEKHPMEVDYSAIVLGYVSLAG